MRKYEVIVTLDADLNEEAVNAQLEKIRAMVTSFEGKIISEENSGRQALSYPMRKKSFGIYVLMIVEAKPEFVAEFTRQMRINDSVLRFMAVLRDDASGESIKRAEERSSRPSNPRDSRGGDRDNRGDRESGRERSSRSRDKAASSDSDDSSDSNADQRNDDDSKEARA